MDSRIREIEQWVAEAKHDLGSCGPEEYYRKLFLLDAEIRTAIKQSGCLPEAASPQHQAKRVRRFFNPSLALTGTIGVLFLAATTVYLNRPIFPAAPAMAVTAPAASSGSTYNPQNDRGHLPNPASFTDGEELIPDAMLIAELAQQEQTPVPAQTALENGAKTSPVPLQLANAKPSSKARPAAKQPGMAKPVASHTPAVVVLAKNTKTPKPQPAANNEFGGTSSEFGVFNDATVSRFTHFPEGEGNDDDSASSATDKSSKAAKGRKGNPKHDVAAKHPANDVDSTSNEDDENLDKLDPEALKDKLEKRFDH